MQRKFKIQITKNKKQTTDILRMLHNKEVSSIIRHYTLLCTPKRVRLITGTKTDLAYVRRQAIKHGEELPLTTKGHTIHFDGIFDQGRDLENTKVLVSGEHNLSRHIHVGERRASLSEMHALLKNIMKGREMLVLFFCLGPKNSPFSIPALQITDSYYVAHSEMILYREGLSEFKRLKGSKNFFHFIHASGELEYNVSKNPDKKRIYIDLAENRVFSVNTQYAGNSVGLKKLALRLAIRKANGEHWLCEHMLLMKVKPKGKKRTTYFAGAFPSACGKTSTAMIPNQEILGDDIAYIKKWDDGWAHAVNVEQGIFGIIENINSKDDPLIYTCLTTPRELIFSNVLLEGGKPHWLGMGTQIPKKGHNFSGNWEEGKKDITGNDIPPAHKNARYTMRLSELSNADPLLDDPNGAPVSGIIYGGRDSNISPPVVESFDWNHGVLMGASLESETTAATLGKQGIRKHNPMANLDFLVIPLGTYIHNHFTFGKHVAHPPKIFNTNYFLKKNGEFVAGKLDKKIWLLWMEGRIHNDFDVLETPIGYIPRYENLTKLFEEIFSLRYAKERYAYEFSIRVDALLEKLDRIEQIYLEEKDVPDELFKQLKQQRRRLVKTHKITISPFDL